MEYGYYVSFRFSAVAVDNTQHKKKVSIIETYKMFVAGLHTES